MNRKFILISIFIAIFLIFNISTANADTTSDLLGYWTCDTAHESGGDILDQAGSEDLTITNDGTIVSDGIVGQSCFFDGSGDELVGSDNNDYDAGISQERTFSVMVNTSANSSISFFSKRAAGNPAGSYMIQTAASSLDMYFWSDHTPISGNGYGIANGNWTLLSIVINATNNTILWYRNTEMIASSTAMSSNFADTDGIFGFGDNGANGGYFNGQADELRVYTRALNGDDIAELFNDILGNSETTTASPNFIHPTPEDSDRNNTQVTLNMTCSDGDRFSLYFDTNTQPSTLVLDNTTSGEYTTAAGSDGDYSYLGTCYNTTTGVLSANSTIRTWTLDTSKPSITFRDNNGFLTNNLSFDNQYADTLNLNITFSDENELYFAFVNISLNGIMYYNYSNSSMEALQTAFNLTDTVDSSAFPAGLYDINITSSDSHTKNKIKDYDISNFLGFLDFKTPEGNDFTIVGQGAISSNTRKEEDRYHFGFNYLLGGGTLTFRVESEYKIDYLPDSQYKGHFVILNPHTKEGNWIDFEGLEGDVSVEKVNDYKYKVTVKNKKNKNYPRNIEFNSVGSLNTITKSYTWYKGTYATTFQSSTTAELNTTFELNLTRNSTLIIDLEANIYYNGTIRNIDKTTHEEYIYFYTDFKTPTVDVIDTYNFYWEVNVTQNDSSSYLFNTTTESQTVSIFDINNCSIGTPTLNVTILNHSNSNQINASLDISFFFNLTTTFKNTSFQYPSTSFQQFCITPNSTQVNSDILAEYTVGSVVYDYHVNKTILSNATQSINLFHTDGTTQVLFTVVDKQDTALPNALIHVLKYDVGTNTYSTIEILKTDTDGEALGNVVLTTDWYKFLIYLGSELKLQTEAEKLISTTKKFRIDTSGGSFFDNIDDATGIGTTLNFTNSSKNFAFTFSNPTGISLTGCLEVQRHNVSTKQIIGNNCTTSSSATMLMNIGNFFENQQFYATSTVKLNNDEKLTDVLEVRFDNAWKMSDEQDGIPGIFFTILLSLAFGMVGLWSPVASIVLLLTGILLSTIVGAFIISTPMIMTLIILGAILLFRVSRE